MKQSTFRLLESAWITLTPVYLCAVYIATYGWTLVSTEVLWTASVVLGREYIEDELYELLERFTNLEGILKMVQKTTRNSSWSMNPTARIVGKVFLVSLLLVLNVTNPGPTIQHLLFRLFLVLVFIVKHDSNVALRRTVAYYNLCPSLSSGAASGGRPARAWFGELTALVGCTVWLPANPTGEGVAPIGTAAAIDSASLENILLSPSVPAAAGVGKGALTGGAPVVLPIGAPTLLAVLHFAAAETAVVALCVAAPVLSAALDTDSADGYGGRIYSPAGCSLLVLGATVQCAVLSFCAGYMQYRSTIALELRRPELRADRSLGSILSNSGISRSDSSEGPTAADASTAGAAQHAKGSTGILGGSVVMRLMCALIDCDAHTVCTASSGCLTRSPADLFASGMAQASAAPPSGSAGRSSSAGGHAGESASGGGSSSGGRSSKGRTPSAGAGDSGKGRSAVTAGHSSAKGAPGSSTAAGLSKTASSPAAQAQSTDGPAVQGGAQSYMLNLALVAMLAATTLQMALILSGLLDQRSAAGAVLSGCGSLAVAAWLRAALPGALLGLSGGTAGGASEPTASAEWAQ